MKLNKPKIKIVEDELSITNDGIEVLNKHGYEALIGTFTVKATISKTEKEDFELITIKTNLQNKSDNIILGNYLLQKKETPFIYITIYEDEKTFKGIKKTKPNAVIKNPYNSIDITTYVSVVINNYKFGNKTYINDFKLPKSIQAVIQYIELNINQKIDIHQLSNLTKWSHHHFIKIFTKYLNQTPYQFILKNKIEKAKTLMHESDQSLQKIASDLGFGSYSNFCNAFKKETKKAPADYRKLYDIYLNNKSQ